MGIVDCKKETGALRVCMLGVKPACALQITYEVQSVFILMYELLSFTV